MNKKMKRTILFERKVLAKSVLVLGVYPGFRKSPTHRNVMKTKLDETNLAIIKALRNGRASFRDIAADLGLSEVTVRTRAARLIEDGVLELRRRPMAAVRTLGRAAETVA